jgi:DNA-binding CsgD family transcriptional regulator
VSESLRNPALAELLDPNRRHAKETIELTARQREVLQLLVEGKSAKQIAADLNISPRRTSIR